MLRGINRKNIFEDEEDKEKFLQTVIHYKAISEYKLFAYCLMSNHIHLLIKVEKNVSKKLEKFSFYLLTKEKNIVYNVYKSANKRTCERGIVY